MLTFIIQVVGGFVLLIWAADRLVSGASATARNFGIPPIIIGLTIVGFGTSSPELVVSAVASLKGNDGLAVGNAIGSNITNIGLILGLTAVIYPLQLQSSMIKREYPALLLIMLLTLLFCINLTFSRWEGIIFLAGLVGLVLWLIRFGQQSPQSDPFMQELAAEIPTGVPTRIALFWILVSLIVLPGASYFLVQGSVGIARTFGVSDTVIGLTLIAFGTSLPELATSIASAFRREDDLAVGNIIGSNMFNLLGVLGLAATISPISLEPAILSRDIPVMFLMTGLMFLLASKFGSTGGGRIGRPAGVMLLAVMIAYQFMLW